MVETPQNQQNFLSDDFRNIDLSDFTRILAANRLRTHPRVRLDLVWGGRLSLSGGISETRGDRQYFPIHFRYSEIISFDVIFSSF